MASIGSCLSCCGPLLTTGIMRVIGGFKEYIASNATTNPVTYFQERRFKSAAYSFSFDPTGSSCTCFTGSAIPPRSTYRSYSFALSQAYTELTNVPSAGTTGTDAAGAAIGFTLSEFDLPGFLCWYDATKTVCSASGSSSGCAGAIGGGGAICGGAGGGANYGLCPGGSGSALGGTMVSLCFTEGGCQSSTLYYTTNSEFFESGLPPSSPTALPITQYNDSGQLYADCMPNYSFLCDTSHGTSISGSTTASSGTLTSTTFTGIVSTNCVGVQYAKTSGDCFDWLNSALVYTANSSGALTNEVDYSAVFSSVTSMTNIAAAFAEIIANGYGSGTPFTFNDAPYPPTSPGTTDYTPYDGSLILIPSGSGMPGDGPFVAGPFSASWISFGQTEFSQADQIVACSTAQQAMVTSPYLLATYVVMADSTLIYESCTTGTATGKITIPVPSLDSLPNTYGVIGGILTGPVGRITCLLTGVNCTTWDKGNPTPFFNVTGADASWVTPGSAAQCTFEIENGSSANWDNCTITLALSGGVTSVTPVTSVNLGANSTTSVTVDFGCATSNITATLTIQNPLFPADQKIVVFIGPVITCTPSFTFASDTCFFSPHSFYATRMTVNFTNSGYWTISPTAKITFGTTGAECSLSSCGGATSTFTCPTIGTLSGSGGSATTPNSGYFYMLPPNYRASSSPAESVVVDYTITVYDGSTAVATFSESQSIRWQ